MELDGLTCLVTGANRGIGRAIAERLAQHPVHVLAGVRSLDRWEPIGGDVEPVAIDLAAMSWSTTRGSSPPACWRPRTSTRSTRCSR
jgi:NAD(P)-dependent dehydrogenase (short-subunit alcohol dehydrogenase family)